MLLGLVIPSIVLLGGLLNLNFPQNVLAQTPVSCQPPPSNTGVATANLDLSESGIYYVWSRIMSAGDNANSYWLQIDNNCGMDVGDLNGMAANTWTWVNYQNGSASNVINLSLSAGTHTIKMFGREAGAKLDELIFTKNSSCLPVGTGDNCLSVSTPTPTPSVPPVNSPSLSPSPTQSLTPTSSPTSFPGAGASLSPVADTFVMPSAPNNNYGAKENLEIDGSPVKIAYMKFDLSALAGKNISSAKLRLKVTNYSHGVQNIRSVDNNSWSESDLKYSNIPSTSGVITTTHGGNVGSWVEADLTSAVRAKTGQLFSLEIDSSAKDALYVASKESKESSDRPVLLIEYPASSPTPGSSSSGITVLPLMDTYVKEDSPSSSYGSSDQIRVDGSPIVRSYLKFDVQGISGPVTSAKLRIYANSSQAKGFDVRAVADNNWSDAITYVNAPPVPSTVLGSSGTIASGNWYEIDVTPAISKNGMISFVLTTTDVQALSLASKESSHPPVLIIK